MISPIRSLFLFTKPQIDCAFQHARLKKYLNGMKLLQAPASCKGNDQGSLLIMIPRASGKAHDRNLFRRRVKAIFYGDKLYTIPSTWILLVQKQAIDLSFDQIRKFLMEAMNGHAHKAKTTLSS
jgi:ribonuclease P protein component